jgi:4-alpha-glucanotransferase
MESTVSKVLLPRHGGILLHPSSLPGDYGIGDLGSEIFRFIDFLYEYDQNLWQILPLGPTGYGNSPYQCFSAFAGNPLLISPEKMIQEGLLTTKESKFPFPEKKHRVDYGKAITFKQKILKIAFQKYSQNEFPDLEVKMKDFFNLNSYWLDDYALFMSLKDEHNLAPWYEWEPQLRDRNSPVIIEWENKKENEIDFVKFCQFLFFSQWKEVKKYSKQRNIKIIGDIPIFVAHDSVDVWSNPHMYYMTTEGDLEYVAGVPPDYFSSTGQRWGNPLYRWDLMKKERYNWWIQRIKHTLEQVDIVRIDHFRGFESYWQIPAQKKTAIKGQWIPGPGIDLFLALKENLGVLPIIAEDLGIITPEVDDLLAQTGFPGMKVLQFAFDDISNETERNMYLPHNYTRNSIVYTGTHDNPTTLAWFESLSPNIQSFVLDYIKTDSDDIVGDFIRLAWSSVASMAVIPLQDLLRLGSKSRMNHPGTTENNWEWRFSWNEHLLRRGKELAKLTRLYDRK